MRLISPIYDQRDEKYPIYHLGILAFIITTGIPLNLGMTKLPSVDIILLFIGGFFSLFMITRNDNVGQSFLSHLHIRARQQNPVKIKQKVSITKTNNLQYKTPALDHGTIHTIQDPFFLLQNAVEQIIISHEDNMDMATKVKLYAVHRKLVHATNRLCKL
jgi:hypothetical protein